MAKFTRTIKTSEFEENTCAPVGTYKVVIKKAEEKQSANNPDNKYLNCQMSIVSGKYKGMGFFTMYNLWNSNENATRIAESQFKNLMLAMFGEDKDVTRSEQIVNHPFMVELGIDDNADFGKRNVIKKYIKADAVDTSNDDQEDEPDAEDEPDETADEAWAKPGKDKKNKKGKKGKKEKKAKKQVDEEDDD